ncbi:guanylate kinase [Candidatus Cyanaurora vandensis]|uniref:guanylate kinase n=1 Tax=Candidatus Cyanaurora vandensis TaxID=2714958 RepID=UPI00257E9912|nr:guanylate kinase [Candidatus Cyanaurora vandensis]
MIVATTGPMANSGRLIVLTGPSGVGKGTLVSRLLRNRPALFLSVSATTRAPRPNEVEGVHYYFITRTKFEELIAQGQLLEWAEYLSNYYGTPRQAVLERLATGADVLLEIEVEGARQVLKTFPQAITIFILPPSLSTLAARLKQRRTESPEVITRRLTKAAQEITHAPEFSHRIVNDQLAEAVAQLEAILYPA